MSQMQDAVVTVEQLPQNTALLSRMQMDGFQSGPLLLMGFLIPALTLSAAKGHTVGPWDTVSFRNLIHFAVCGFCGATAGPCVRPVWRSRSITPRELHALMVSGLFSSLFAVTQIHPNTYGMFEHLCLHFVWVIETWFTSLHLNSAMNFSLMRLLHFYWRCQKLYFLVIIEVVVVWCWSAFYWKSGPNIFPFLCIQIRCTTNTLNITQSASQHNWKRQPPLEGTQRAHTSVKAKQLPFLCGVFLIFC